MSEELKKPPCEQCNAHCCRNVKSIPWASHLADENGICTHLDQESNLCTIYEERPLFCNWIESWKQRDMDVTYQEFYDRNIKYCEDAIELFESTS
jgi:Fe-S-cluster containining protein